MAETAQKSTKAKSNKKTVGIAAAVLICLVAIGVGAFLNAQNGKLPDEPIPAKFAAGLQADDAERTNGTDTRVMSACLSAPAKEPVTTETQDNSSAGEPMRAKMFLAVMEKFTPDVIGVQDCNEIWYSCLKKNMPQAYRFVSADSSRETRLIYNTELLTLVESKTLAFGESSAPEERCAEWAKFTRKDSENAFIVVTTHLDSQRESAVADAAAVMQKQADALIDLVNGLKEQHNCPVILSGNFNAAEDTPRTQAADAKEIYKLFAEACADAKQCAYRAKSGNGWSLSEPLLDHIFLNGDCKTTRFRIVSDLYMRDFAEHYPIYADFEI